MLALHDVQDVLCNMVGIDACNTAPGVKDHVTAKEESNATKGDRGGKLLKMA